MRSTHKSLANEYGITQKNLTQNPSLGIGLNPNLNIEDEYIENLLKQVHFLNMEIKLIKQKQKENKGMGIMGLLNKDQSPVITHAITSNAKFSQMKGQLSGMVNNATAEYLRLDDQNFAVKAQREYLERISLKQEQKNIQNKMYVERELTDGIDKLRNQQKKLQQLREQNDKLSELYRRLKHDWEKTTNEQKTKNLLKEISANLESESHGLREKHLEDNCLVHESHSKKLNQMDQLYRKDQNYMDLVDQNKQLKEKVKKTDKQLYQMNYKVKQMEQLKKLSIKNKDVEQDLKKQAGQQCERMKKKLADKKNDMESKLKDAKQALQTNDEVRLLKGKTARKDKETSDLRRRTDASQNNYKKLRDQVMRLEASLQIRNKLNTDLQKQVNQLTAMGNETDVELKKTELDYEQAEAELRTSETSLKEVRTRLESLEQEAAYLNAKQEHLQKSVDLDEEMRKVKIEQLTSLAQGNTDLNTTITDIMDKWQQIIRFSREPPA